MRGKGAGEDFANHELASHQRAVKHAILEEAIGWIHNQILKTDIIGVSSLGLVNHL